jgi:IclR family KDG regulon transcriptional repressor
MAIFFLNSKIPKNKVDINKTVYYFFVQPVEEGWDRLPVRPRAEWPRAFGPEFSCSLLHRSCQLPTRGKESYSIHSVENALDLLEALCDEPDEFRISQLSEKLGMNKTSVFRLLATFENRGYVEREKGSGKYRLGLSAYEISQKFLARMGLLHKARPIMERLSRECNEAVYLTVSRGEELLFFDLVDTTHQVKIISLVGKRYPLRQVAAGKLILAYPPKQNWDEGNATGGILPEELQKIRQRGYECDRGGLGESIVSLAVPLFGANGEIVGALCLVGPDFRLPEEKLETQFLPPLREAGEVISFKLGYLGHYLGKKHL